MDVDEGLIARALARCGGAGIHDTKNKMCAYRSGVNCARICREQGKESEAQKWELYAAKYAHILALIADGVHPKVADGEAVLLFGYPSL